MGNMDSLDLILTVAAFIVGIMLLTGHGDIFMKGGNADVRKKLYDEKKMAILEYGIGGNEVKVDTSEAIANIPENRSLIVEQLTADEPVTPEAVKGLSTIEEVFAHFLPNIDVEFENEEGQPVKENFRFSSVADFSVKNMTQNSPFLHKLDTEKTFYEGMVTQLRSNKVLQRVLENPESKKAFISALEALSNELKTE